MSSMEGGFLGAETGGGSAVFASDGGLGSGWGMS